jgi:hypothetical protein
MTMATFGIGDLVMLADGPLRTARAEGRFKIMAILPVANGMVQYRVRSESEGFDRRISSGDIDHQITPATHVVEVEQASGKDPWFKPISIKVGK